MIPFELYKRNIGRSTSIMFSTKRGNNFIGKIVIEYNGKQSSIWSLEVRYPFEKQGFGTLLLEKAEEIAREQYKSDTIYLYCYSHRLSFYLDRGYVATRRYTTGNDLKYDMLKVVQMSNYRDG